MLALLQRVTEASVAVDGEVVGAIGHGLMVLVGFERGDTQDETAHMLQRLLGYRVFSDSNGKMNLSVADVGGELLLVPQFTLPADTSKGRRPSFTPAAPAAEGAILFDHLVSLAQSQPVPTAIGRFAADMQVSLVNDGPVTFMLRTRP